MDTRLKDGDMLFDLIDDPINVYGKTKDQVLKEIVKEDKLSDEESKGNLLHVDSVYKNKIFGSSPGSNYMGVMSHHVLKKYEKMLGSDSDDSYDSDQEEETPKMESRIVIRLKDEALGRLHGETCSRWAKFLSPDELKDRPKLQYGTVKLFVPFTEWNVRNADDQDRKKLHEIYRAFRAYMRNHATPVIPLSKNKGISCNQFIEYSLKAAMIERLLPKDKIEKILQKMQEIESIKHKGDESGKPFKKLKQIPKQLFEDFDKLVIDCFREAQDAKDHQIPNREKYINYLYSPVKKSSIDYLGSRIIQNPEIFDFRGYFCVIKDKKGDTPGVLDHDSYLKLIKPKKASREAVPHDVFITRKEIDALSTPVIAADKRRLSTTGITVALAEVKFPKPQISSDLAALAALAERDTHTPAPQRDLHSKLDILPEVPDVPVLTTPAMTVRAKGIKGH